MPPMYIYDTRNIGGSLANLQEIALKPPPDLPANTVHNHASIGRGFEASSKPDARPGDDGLHDATREGASGLCSRGGGGISPTPCQSRVMPQGHRRGVSSQEGLNSSSFRRFAVPQPMPRTTTAWPVRFAPTRGGSALPPTDQCAAARSTRNPGCCRRPARG